ncbi:hypothetical protein LBMAG52_09670 [Planctomycetia bacterium]|nr:hypothetical protein LBMAG52_09670 [Planctomycetia bacterium]
MFVSMATIRRGIAFESSALNAGRMASSHGSDIATPAPRKNARRDNELRIVEKPELMKTLLLSQTPVFCKIRVLDLIG